MEILKQPNEELSPTKYISQIREVHENHPDERIQKYRKWKESYEESRADGKMLTIIGNNNVSLRREMRELQKSLLIAKEANKSLLQEKRELVAANGKLIAEIGKNKNDMQRVALLKESVSTLIKKHKKTKSLWRLQERELLKLREENDYLINENKNLRQHNLQYSKITPEVQADMAALNDTNNALLDENNGLKILVEELRSTAHNNLKYALKEKAVTARGERRLKSANNQINTLKQLTMEMAASLKYHDGRGFAKSRLQIIKSLEDAEKEASANDNEINDEEESGRDSLLEEFDYESSSSHYNGEYDITTGTEDSAEDNMAYDNTVNRGPHFAESKKKSYAKGKKSGSSKLLKSYPNDLIYDLESHLIEMNSPVIYQKNKSMPKKQRKLSSLFIQQAQQPQEKGKYEKYVDEYVKDEYVEAEVDEEGKVLEDEIKRLNELLEKADNLNKSINYGFVPSKEEEIVEENNVEKYQELIKHHSKSVIDLSSLTKFGESEL